MSNVRPDPIAHIFAIHVCAYAVMSNHYHLVLEIDAAQAEAWTTEDVILRWHRLFKGNLFSQRFVRGEALAAAEREALDNCVAVWRSRLVDISWFMRQINEPIARDANAEDNCTGRFCVAAGVMWQLGSGLTIHIVSNVRPDPIATIKKKSLN